jgi:N-acetylneuraminate synthase
MLKKLELKNESYFDLESRCKEKKIDFLSTAFDLDSLNFLVSNFNLKYLKVPSGEITNGPFLLSHAVTGKNIILSTGMSTLQEIEKALSILAFGYLKKDKRKKISKRSFIDAFNSPEGKEMLKRKVIILHCTSDYPASIKEINLGAMETIRNKFNTKIGYSDHSEGFLASLSAAILGANVIEKHFTKNKYLNGPDHKASLNPKELKQMISLIREFEVLKGSDVKKPSKSEIKNLKIVRKSIVANENIKKGERFTEENLTFKRPGGGMSPMNLWKILGSKSKKDYKKDDII